MHGLVCKPVCSCSQAATATELSQWFASVTLDRYADALVVPEAEPLVMYVRSTGRLTEDELTRFQDYVQDLIAQHGPIRISKDVGMFEAAQPRTRSPSATRCETCATRQSENT